MAANDLSLFLFKKLMMCKYVYRYHQKMSYE